MSQDIYWLHAIQHAIKAVPHRYKSPDNVVPFLQDRQLHHMSTITELAESFRHTYATTL